MDDAALVDVHRLFDSLISAEESQALEPADRPAPYSDEALALRFTARHRDDVKYVHKWGWMYWNDRYWERDDSYRVIGLCRSLCREASAEVLATGTKGCQGLARAIGSRRTVEAVEKLARADRAHVSATEEWDADPWLLNTPEGTVDLREGKLSPHSQLHKITKTTKVAPGGECPVWHSVIRRIFGSDEKVIAYVRRMLGYCLTGSTAEHALFFCYGTGRNGKGTLLNTVHDLLGDYAAVAPMSTFTASMNERHPTELAMLRGARLVSAQETEAGQQWAEAKIKALTGGDPISARFMRQDFFTYAPQFKLVIAGNHKPELRSVDVAIRRRMNLIPFIITIPEEEADPDLREKLREEWAGILQWLIDGCLEYRRIGLAPPSAIVEATEQYLSDEDSIGRFITECCDRSDPNGIVELTAFALEYEIWCRSNGESAVTPKRLSQVLNERGIRKAKDSISRRAIFRGIKLIGQSGDPAGASGPAKPHTPNGFKGFK